MLPDTTHYQLFERVDRVERTDHGVLAHLHGERLRVDVVAPDVVRLMMSRGGRFDEQPTHSVCVDPLAGGAAFEVAEDDDVVRVRTDELVVSLGLEPFRVDVHRTDGSPVLEAAQDEDGRPLTYATLNDAFVSVRAATPEDAVYGLGEKTGRHNRRGRTFTMWNTDVLEQDTTGLDGADGPVATDPREDPRSTEFDPYYVSIPFFHHQRWPGGDVAGFFLDNAYRTHYDLTAPDRVAVHATGGHWCEYVIGGPAMPDVLRAYTHLTGRASLPPMWSLGYHQSRWREYTQEQVEGLGRRHREEGVPCDALWLDIEYMDGYRVFTWDEERFPDHQGMLARLREQGFRVITIIDPGVKHDPGYRVFDEAVERDVLCRTESGDLYVGQVWPGRTAFPDFATPEARQWWGALNAEHVRSGLAGIWNDMNEPATGAIAPDAMRFDRGRASHERYHNQYALLMAMGTVAGLREAMPDLRTFVLTRAGFAGIQRYAAHWMGDNMSRWDHLWLSIPMANGFGLSGQPFVGADVGGFFGSSNAELFLRWTQHGALTPFFRNHSSMGNVDQYAWSFGPAVLDVAREAVRLRYRLLPYLYAAFVEATETGLPVQRPLVLDHQDDAMLRDVDDEYLLGRHVLVAPVTGPGVTHRQVYLPEGDWYDRHTDEVRRGRRFVTAEAPMERIPVLVRAGAVLPMWPEAPESTDGYHPEVVELHVYLPVRDGTWTSLLQEDDGLTTRAVDDDARWRTTFTVTREGASTTVRAEVTGAGYPEFRREAFRVVLHGQAPARARLDGADVVVDGGAVRVPTRAGEGFVLEVVAEDPDLA